MTPTEKAEMFNLRQTLGNHECALRAMDAVNAKLKEENAKLRAALNEIDAVAETEDDYISPAAQKMVFIARKALNP